MPTVHSACRHNELAALNLRVLGDLPASVFGPLGAPVLAVFRKLRWIARAYGGVKMSHLEAAETYSGMLRRRYLEAARSLLEDGPVSQPDAFLRAFLKAEKVYPGTRRPKPRLIFPRSPRYNLDLASRLKPFESWLWSYLTGRRLFGGSNTRVVLKGLNPQQRANCLLRKFETFRRCVVFELDAVAFEAHVGPGVLREEHAVYCAAFPGDRGLRRLLRYQCGLQGQTLGGYGFDRPGARASGDYNTGMGNSLTMLAVVVGCLRSLDVVFDVAVDGDNALVFLEACEAPGVVEALPGLCVQHAGFEVKLERPVSVMEEIRFGRSAPIYLGPRRGWIMVRDYRSVLSGAFASPRWRSLPGGVVPWVRGVAMCELSLARGVPILQEWALRVLESCDTRKKVRDDNYREYFALGAWLADETCVQTVLPETRLSFEAAFGVTPEEQIAIESGWRGVVPTPGVLLSEPKALDLQALRVFEHPE